MADDEHVRRLRDDGVEGWNEWRRQNPSVVPDLSGADLRSIQRPGADLTHSQLGQAWLTSANLREANLYSANLSDAKLCQADLTGANLVRATLIKTDLTGAVLNQALLVEARLWSAILREASLRRANLSKADFHSADLQGADLWKVAAGYANFFGAKLQQANLSQANLLSASLVFTDLRNAILSDALIHGAAVWDVDTEGTIQRNLVITPEDAPIIAVDDLEVAQFVYLLLNNQKIRRVFDTISSKAVLILGRFTPERKAVLDALRTALREKGFVPILFDFDKPAARDTVETISALAHLCFFIFADLSAAKSVLQELQQIVPSHPSVPVLPLIQADEDVPGMLDHLRRYPWFLDTWVYDNRDHLLENLADLIVSVEAKARELKP